MEFIGFDDVGYAESLSDLDCPWYVTPTNHLSLRAHQSEKKRLEVEEIFVPFLSDCPTTAKKYGKKAE